MNKDDLLPCPRCHGNNLFFDKCVGTVRCLKCFAKNPEPDAFIEQGYSKNDAGIMAWNTWSKELWKEQ